MSNAQIQKYKYTNTQIRHLTKCLKDPTCGIFLKRGVLQHHSATSASEMAIFKQLFEHMSSHWLDLDFLDNFDNLIFWTVLTILTAFEHSDSF